MYLTCMYQCLEISDFTCKDPMLCQATPKKFPLFSRRFQKEANSHMTPIVTGTLLGLSEAVLGCQGRQWHNATIKRQWKLPKIPVFYKIKAAHSTPR